MNNQTKVLGIILLSSLVQAGDITGGWEHLGYGTMSVDNNVSDDSLFFLSLLALSAGFVYSGLEAIKRGTSGFWLLVLGLGIMMAITAISIAQGQYLQGYPQIYQGLIVVFLLFVFVGFLWILQEAFALFKKKRD